MSKPVETMTERDMLAICMDWLENVCRQDRERYLSAMPNNVPGIPLMRARARALGDILVCTFCGAHLVDGDRTITDRAGDHYHAMCAQRANATVTS